MGAGKDYDKCKNHCFLFEQFHAPFSILVVDTEIVVINSIRYTDYFFSMIVDHRRSYFEAAFTTGRQAVRINLLHTNNFHTFFLHQIKLCRSILKRPIILTILF